MHSDKKRLITFTIDTPRLLKNISKCDQLYIDETLFVLPNNDGEAKRSCQILRSLKAPFLHISEQTWGATLDKELEHINWERFSKIKRVLVFEMPARETKEGLSAEKFILDKGLELVIVDHHYYAWIDRYKSESSLEQLCQLIGWEMDFMDQAIAVNDRSYIPGLKKVGLSNEEIVKIREYDFKAQGFSADYIASQRELAHENTPALEKKRKGDLWIFENLKVEKNILLQELALDTPDGIVHALEIKGNKLSFSGSPKVVQSLLNFDFTKYGFKKGYHSYGGGDERGSKFWGFRPRYGHERVSSNFLEKIYSEIAKNISISNT